ncbi:hypothetical protein [Jeotgalibaca ciconiae]|uniref:Uncharacterized protein n=1 Tax=Jeotgalibaca ciconiae TaxID=2496265 RepID=A0A3S9H8P7_9LACT|nr:hypothetical protein [Jeotgalibaca ciconiae]AZP03728.1 hypothetical protein EJN90_03055 [Jeotgalibaca ciconiae]
MKIHVEIMGFLKAKDSLKITCGICSVDGKEIEQNRLIEEFSRAFNPIGSLFLEFETAILNEMSYFDNK